MRLHHRILARAVALILWTGIWFDLRLIRRKQEREAAKIEAAKRRSSKVRENGET